MKATWGAISPNQLPLPQTSILDSQRTLCLARIQTTFLWYLLSSLRLQKVLWVTPETNYLPVASELTLETSKRMLHQAPAHLSSTCALLIPDTSHETQDQLESRPQVCSLYLCPRAFSSVPEAIQDRQFQALPGYTFTSSCLLGIRPPGHHRTLSINQ